MAAYFPSFSIKQSEQNLALVLNLPGYKWGTIQLCTLFLCFYFDGKKLHFECSFTVSLFCQHSWSKIDEICYTNIFRLSLFPAYCLAIACTSSASQMLIHSSFMVFFNGSKCIASARKCLTRPLRTADYCPSNYLQHKVAKHYPLTSGFVFLAWLFLKFIYFSKTQIKDNWYI